MLTGADYQISDARHWRPSLVHARSLHIHFHAEILPLAGCRSPGTAMQRPGHDPGGLCASAAFQSSVACILSRLSAPSAHIFGAIRTSAAGLLLPVGYLIPFELISERRHSFFVTACAAIRHGVLPLFTDLALCHAVTSTIESNGQTPAHAPHPSHLSGSMLKSA